MASLKIVAISDTHTQASRLTIPACDVLVHAEDSTYSGNFFEVRDFIEWLKLQPATHKVVIAGNHEITFDKYHRKYNESIKDLMLNCSDPSIHYLEDSDVIINGIKFYGTPWSPWFYDWGFNGVESGTVPFTNNPHLRDIYGKIHNNTQILICHAPCYGCADKGGNGNSDERLGSMDLLRRVQQIKPIKLVIGGHIHEARGIVELEGRIHANVSSLDRDYETIRPPIVFNVEHDNDVIQSVTYEKIPS
jgi:hypothetical protein